MATAAAAASLRYFPSSIRNRSYPGTIGGGAVVTFSPRRGRCATAAVAAPSREAEPASSLGDLTRVDFPILDQEFDGNKLVYFDNGATSQKPSHVMKALDDYYRFYNSNVHRGIHALSAKATDAYESARRKVANFVNAADSREIIFTRNATEAINLVAYSWGLSNLKQGDEIILTVAEHHSAIVPWQFVSQKTGAVLKYVGLTKEEVPDIEQLKGLLSSKTKIVVVHHVSNVLGSMLPIEEVVSCANKVGAKVLVDACQSVPHMPVDVQKLGADFLVASSHKMCGPTGVGFLHGKFEILSSMEPFLGGGGEMIADVFEDKSTYAEPPSRFEAGTPAIGEAIGLGVAIDYLSHFGMQRIHEYEKELGSYLYESLLSVPNVRIYGPAPSASDHRAPLCSFNVENVHPTDIAEILDLQHGVAIRSGHHCAQILHRTLGINASARASLHFYNTKEEVDAFIHGLKATIDFLTSHH
ncbi:unnamed protein product [Triticum turgidum subsp. durum]|uniref:cysteine desulfurase n=1 Tax=Triticum turgidum subsp. durum TaxID=4567 RepID=A0A9R0SYG8_TRITD|nr:unnamed protein product [Triticum turgidum subsp. durum]